MQALSLKRGGACCFGENVKNDGLLCAIGVFIVILCSKHLFINKKTFAYSRYLYSNFN